MSASANPIPSPARTCRQHLIRRAKTIHIAQSGNHNFGTSELAQLLHTERDKAPQCNDTEVSSEGLSLIAEATSVLFPADGKDSDSSLVYSGDEWLDLDLGVESADVIAGSTANPLIRARTKNFLEAPEKSFKTTLLLRWAAAAAKGVSVFPALPVLRPLKTLYLHGELSPSEIKERFRSSIQELEHPFPNFYQGRDLKAHLIREDGQKAIRRLVYKYQPELLILDPWQSFISGYDENSFKDMSTATHFLDTLIQDTGVTLIIPIHLGKDRSRGARGHSTLAGWRDTRIVLEPIKNNTAVSVDIYPRWAKHPDPFVLKFSNGTVWPGEMYSPQTSQIRKLVTESKGRIGREDLKVKLGITSDQAFRKALQRAKDDGAVAVTDTEVTLPLDELMDQDFGMGEEIS